jgi:hypothetical protein
MRKVLRMWHQLEYLKRHHQTVIRHLNPRRAANILLNEYEMRRRRVVLKSRPPFLKVEPTAACQLHCPGCPWHAEEGARHLPAQPHLSFSDFQRLIDPVKDTTVEISFSFRGDAFMNREVFDMIGYCRDNNIGSVIPTNFSYKLGDDVIEKIVDSGLDHIIVAVDGSNQDTYQMYRKGGHLEWVLDNSRRLIDLKRRKQSKTPLVECKFITFAHNEHQFDEVKQLSHSMGFDRFSSVLDHFDPRRQDDHNQIVQRSSRKKKPCYWVYRTAVICYDGQVCACCNDTTNLGNALSDGLPGVWNNEHYRSMRTMFATGKPTDANGRSCIGCRSFWASGPRQGQSSPPAA